MSIICMHGTRRKGSRMKPWEALEILKKQGKTRAIGLSTHDPNAMAEHIRAQNLLA